LDLTEFYNPNTERLIKFWTILQDTWLALIMTPLPTVAVINVHLLYFNKYKLNINLSVFKIYINRL